MKPLFVQKRQYTQVVTTDDFVFTADEASEVHRKIDKHNMIEEIAKCCRIAAQLLGLCMKLYQKTNTIHGTPPSQIDCNTSLPFTAGLENCTQLPDMKVMGALLNPLYQSHYQMIEAGLLTKKQYWDGKVELLDRITWYYATTRDIANQVIEGTGGNKWDKST
jgi:hypothetical protein